MLWPGRWPQSLSRLTVLVSGGFSSSNPSPLHALLVVLVLVVLWVAVPLIGAAIRPFRRSRETDAVYAWDRFADGLIAALLCGWIVQKTVAVLDQFAGMPLAVTQHANLLAVVTIAAVAARVVGEELAATLYPRRLTQVEAPRELPASHPLQQLLGATIRAAIFTLIGYAFVGNCWQLWVGGALFLVPELIAIFEERYPNFPRLQQVLPKGVLALLVLIVLGTGCAAILSARISDDLTLVRAAFVVMTLPAVVLATMSLFGRQGPTPRWSWPRQLGGAVVVGVTVYLALHGWDY